MAEPAPHVLVTGVSRGIGAAIAKALLYRKVPVVGVARSLDAWQETSPDFLGLELDLTRSDSIEAISSCLNDRGLSLCGLVHNAGTLSKGPVETIERTAFEEMWKLHVEAPFFLSQAMLPYLLSESHVVLVGSMAGYVGSKKFAGLSAYGASKAAMMSFAESWAVEWEGRGIFVNALAIGAAETGMLRKAFPEAAEGASPERLGQWIGEFVMSGHRLCNGRILPLALSDPTSG